MSATDELLLEWRLIPFPFMTVNIEEFNFLHPGVCGSALPYQNSFSSSASEITLAYHQGIEILQEKKSFNLSFTYFSRRKSGGWFLLHFRVLYIYPGNVLIRNIGENELLR